MYKRILVLLDGSILSDLAYKKALTYAKKHDSKLILVTAVDTASVPAGIAPGMIYTDVYQPIVEEAKRRLRGYKQDGGDYIENTFVEIGSIKPTILREIEKSECDVVYMGATGTNALTRMFTGSTTDYIVRRAPVDVLIVRTLEDNHSRPDDEE